MRFHDRPYLVVDADAAGRGLLDGITDPELFGLSARAAIDAITDHVAVTGDIADTRRIVEALTSAPDRPGSRRAGTRRPVSSLGDDGDGMDEPDPTGGRTQGTRPDGRTDER